jgi:hypothetical protein
LPRYIDWCEHIEKGSRTLEISRLFHICFRDFISLGFICL